MSYMLVGDWYGFNAQVPPALIGPSYDPAYFGMQGLGALGAVDPSMVRSALASAQTQAARGNSAEAYRALQQARDWLGQLPVTHPEYGRLQTELGTTSHNVGKHLARTPDEIARFNEGVRASEAAASSYRDYSDVRRSFTDDLGWAAQKTATDVRDLAAGAAANVRDVLTDTSPWIKGAIVIAGLFAAGYAIRAVR